MLIRLHKIAVALLISFFGNAMEFEPLTIYTVDEVLSYQRIKEKNVRLRAGEILRSKILTNAKFYDAALKNSKEVYKALKTRIWDNRRYIATAIEWFKKAHEIYKGSPIDIVLRIHPRWAIWNLERHFRLFSSENVNRDYKRRHEMIDYHIANINDYKKIMQGYKDSFKEGRNIIRLQDLQIEGLALELIYRAVKSQKRKYENLDLSSVKYIAKYPLGPLGI